MLKQLIPRLSTALRSSVSQPWLLSLSRPSLRLSSSATLPFRRAPYATSTTATSSSFDPQTVQAQDALDEGSTALENGDLEGAQESYTRSLGIKETAIAHYNLGVVQYQLQNLPAAIASFHRSLALTPATPPSEPPSPDEELDLTPAQLVLADTHTNLGAAYILSTPPRPDLALEHLQEALAINPDDAELVYNLAAVLEATEDLDEALIAYKRAEALGIGRAGGNLRNVTAKILQKQIKEEHAEVEEARRAAASKDAAAQEGGEEAKSDEPVKR